MRHYKTIGDTPNLMENKTETNSVIYTRKNYLKFLEEVRAALTKLSDLRQAQIDEWKSDTEARQNDLYKILHHRFIKYYKSAYEEYLSYVAEPPVATLIDRVLRRTPKPKVDKYGSLEAYVADKRGQTFAEYMASEVKRMSVYCNDNVDMLGWLSTNWNALTKNTWKDSEVEVLKAISLVESNDTDAKFIIPRDDFNYYSEAIVLAEIGKIEDQVELRPISPHGWY